MKVIERGGKGGVRVEDREVRVEEKSRRLDTREPQTSAEVLAEARNLMLQVVDDAALGFQPSSPPLYESNRARRQRGRAS
jgi:hypothetical protein